MFNLIFVVVAILVELVYLDILSCLIDGRSLRGTRQKCNARLFNKNISSSYQVLVLKQMQHQGD
jgi:hypothetical protein